EVSLTRGGPVVTITLNALDTDPGPMPLSYTIVSGAAPVSPTFAPSIGATLTDPNNGNADVTNGGALAGNQVTVTLAANATGWYAFTFKVSDDNNATFSETATVSVFIQDIDRVVITEIMYDPRMAEPAWE